MGTWDKYDLSVNEIIMLDNRTAVANRVACPTQ